MIRQLSFLDTLRAEVAALPNGIVPRDYQALALDRAFDLFRGGSEGVIVRQPTGTGKTVVGTLIADKWLAQGKDYRVMVLAHERQLIDQFADEIEDILKFRPGIEMAGEAVPANKMPRIVVASRATLYERDKQTEEGTTEKASRLYKFDAKRWHWLVILDECHRWLWSLKSCRHILTHFASNPLSRRLGLTATPERGDKRTLAKVVPDVAADYRLYDVDGGASAVADGWAVPYDQRFVTVEGVDFKTLREVKGDFDEAELENILKEREKLLGLVKPTLDLVGDRRTVCFNVTRNLAKWVAHTFNEFKPGSAQSLDGTAQPYVRKDVYRRHQSGEFQFLCVCGLCREGYNDPGIQAVAVFRPTKARGLAEQMKGRGCRPLRGCVNSAMTREERIAAIAASDKTNCMIIDLVGVTGMADCASTAHILASGKPDEVIARANKNALNKPKDQPIDMGEEIRRAEKEIEEEKENARQKRLEKERKEQEEAERRAKLQAEVRYTAQTVNQGHGARHYQSKRCARMPFGKHKGKPLAEIPHGYLRSIVDGDWCKMEWIKTAAKRELERGKTPAPVAAGVPRGLSIEQVNDLLSTF